MYFQNFISPNAQLGVLGKFLVPVRIFSPLSGGEIIDCGLFHGDGEGLSLLDIKSKRKWVVLPPSVEGIIDCGLFHGKGFSLLGIKAKRNLTGWELSLCGRDL